MSCGYIIVPPQVWSSRTYLVSGWEAPPQRLSAAQAISLTARCQARAIALSGRG